MKIAFFSTAAYERDWFIRYQGHHTITFIEDLLTEQTSQLASGHEAVCAFVEDDLSEPVLQALKRLGIGLVAMRCVGLDNVDLEAAETLGITILHVPAYSPYSVAEHAVALLMGFVRNLPLAHQRVLQGNFSIHGLTGQDLHGKTVGVIGTGHIGQAFSRIMLGFGCRLLAYDIKPAQALLNAGVEYVPLPRLLAESDVVSLHCPLTAQTNQLLNADAIAQIKPTAIVLNSSRGGLVDTTAILNALDRKALGGYAADVYADEKKWFHRDFSNKSVTDETLNRLRSHPRVLLTAHQGFLTQEALQQIAHSLILQISFYQNSRSEGISKVSM
ncbi:2-hydroxyacid dehydrogenase [Larkinella knui]|uniref:2-hydroxyacid dehydrogenase n=1 Tax=Larkinella knui TaxID=2025310 RepID=A0A3P1CF75_9BACT|nr:2-hydroxyacid dehydrogenase [Larkinella knui]RRB11870.1 2-hydroxyacid dehydrogenase [Larkinella knui]